MKKFVIVDGNAIIHRAYHAIPPLTRKDGQIVNAVYGFTSMLLKVWTQLRPEYLAVTFDMAGKTFRHEKYEKYKATRVKADQDLYDQIPMVHEVVETFNIPIYEREGFEADDVIGTIAKKIDGEVETYIVTGDMDAIQLITDTTKIYTLRKGMSDIVIYDEAKAEERYGFGSKLLVDYKSLAGDSSDNIPGVVGVGQKTATDLIQNFGNLENIYKALEKEDPRIKIPVQKKLIADKENAFLSKELAQIDCDVPKLDFDLEKCHFHDFDKEKVIKLFQDYEFVSLLKRVPGMQGVKTPASAGTENVKIKKMEFIEIDNKEIVKKLVKNIKDKKLFACSAVTQTELELLVIVENRGYYIKNKFVDNFIEIFDDPEVELVGIDLKKLIRALMDTVEIKNKLFDVMIASYLLSPGSRTHDATSIVLKILGKSLVASSKQESLFGIDAHALASELYLIAQSVTKLREELEKTNNLGLMQQIEMPLIFVLAEMEHNGIAIDEKKLKELSDNVGGEIKKLTAEIYKLAGEEFNIASTLQLREILFDKLELPTEGIKKGKTGYSTNSEQLEKLRAIHPIIEKIESFREVTKLQNTYIDVLPTLVNKKTGRIHTTFNQAVTATGRLSSSEPNLQNIPIRTEMGREIRKAFVAEKGNSLVVADYSQIELRIVASLAKDKKMMEIFDKGLDIHKATAAAINGVKLEEVTKEMRRAAKEVNFGVLYGMGSFGLSRRTGIPVWQAKEFIQKYFEQFSSVKKYIDTTLAFTKKEGYCETLFGRRRYLPELNSKNFQIRAAAERMATNHPVQGTAADLMKMAMIEVYKAVKNEKGVKMLLQVHDELVLEVERGLERKISTLVDKTMEEVVKLNVPVVVDVHHGQKWGEIK